MLYSETHSQIFEMCDMKLFNQTALLQSDFDVFFNLILVQMH